MQNVPGTIRRHKRLRKHSFRGWKLTVAWRRHVHQHLQTFAEHDQLVGMKGAHSSTSGRGGVGQVAETEDLMLARGKLLKSGGGSRLFAY